MALNGRVGGRLFRLPLLERSVGNNGPLPKEFLFSSGGLGKYFKYTDPLDLDPWNTQQFKGGVIRDTFCIVEAPDAIAAIGTFHREWDGAKVGGPERTAKALWINERKEIIAYPPCRRVHRNPKGRYVCGRPESNDPNELDCSGEFGGCFLDGISLPELCPLYGWDEIKGSVEYNGVAYPIIFSNQLTLDQII